MELAAIRKHVGEWLGLKPRVEKMLAAFEAAGSPGADATLEPAPLRNVDREPLIARFEQMVAKEREATEERIRQLSDRISNLVAVQPPQALPGEPQAFIQPPQPIVENQPPGLQPEPLAAPSVGVVERPTPQPLV